MSHRTFAWTGLCLWSILVSCSSPSRSAYANDFERLQGSWRILSSTDSRGHEKEEKAYIVVSGQKVTWIDRPGVGSELLITILRPRSAPKGIDLLYSQVADDGNVYSDSLLGIYEFAGNRLVFCIALPQNVVDDNYRRPTDFAGRGLGEGVRFVLEKITEELKKTTIGEVVSRSQCKDRPRARSLPNRSRRRCRR